MYNFVWVSKFSHLSNDSAWLNLSMFQMFCQLLDGWIFNILLACLTIKFRQVLNVETCGCKFGKCVQVSRKENCENSSEIQNRQKFSLPVRFVLSFSTISVRFSPTYIYGILCKVLSYVHLCCNFLLQGYLLHTFQ